MSECSRKGREEQKRQGGAGKIGKSRKGRLQREMQGWSRKCYWGAGNGRMEQKTVSGTGNVMGKQQMLRWSRIGGQTLNNLYLNYPQVIRTLHSQDQFRPVLRQCITFRDKVELEQSIQFLFLHRPVLQPFSVLPDGVEVVLDPAVVEGEKVLPADTLGPQQTVDLHPGVQLEQVLLQ